MERSEIKPGLVYVLTEPYCLWGVGTEVEIVEDDGTHRPFSKKVGTTNDTYFVPISKMKPHSKNQCEVCGVHKGGGCRCGKYPKFIDINGQMALPSKKTKLNIGDRIVNNGLGVNNLNAGKFGTVVDYDSAVDEYAIVYDDGGPGCGAGKNYSRTLGPPARWPSRAQIDAAKGQLQVKVSTLQILNLVNQMPTASQIQNMVSGHLTVNGGSGGSSAPKIFNLHEENLGFKVGEKVKFKSVTADNTRIPTFYRDEADGIPNNYIIDGAIEVGDSYFTNWGTVKAITDKYVVVNYDGELGNAVQLGFEPKDLISASWAPKPLDIAALDKLVLDADTKSEIVAVLKQFEHSEKLFTHWGLGETIEYGKGMTMMFWGGPGTGKTWGAHCIAKALGQELMIISAAEIQSSEPGATERNLQDAFRTATEEHKVLFIDECDSIITTRSDLGMILAAQVNCLLTEIEKFEGVCILATNRIETMDEALERRVALIIEFPFPKYAQRIEIWKKLLPTKLPLAEGITPETLAQPKFTGGLIKNIILQAARLALSNGGEAVSQADFDKAIERLKKSKGLMGKRARSETGRPRQDMGMGVGVERKASVDLDTFLDSDEDEEQG